MRNAMNAHGSGGKGAQALVVVVGLVAACLEANPTDGTLLCSPTPPRCPRGYVCSADDTCWREGHAPNTDMGSQDGSDAAPTPDLTGGPDVDLAPPPTLSILAGAPGGEGTADGIGAQARLSFPVGLTSDGTRLWVAEVGSDVLRAITPATGGVA